MSEKVGVYICHCGANIAGVVDVAALSHWAGELPDVAVARDYKFMCSSLGQELIEKDIQELGLTRVVVAACSPHLHEATFRNCCKRAGLNPYLFEMASIREQVSWVTANKTVALEKSKALISGAVHRVIHNQALEPIIVDINPNVLVVGGGITGIQAALEIADAGYHVYLVEREPSIGGHMAQFDKTFPTLDCSACILTPKMFSAGTHPNITLLTWSEVEKVDGYVGNFTVKVRQKARKVNTELCTGCGICEQKCPKKVIDTVFEAGMGLRKAVYTPFPQAVPKYPVMDVQNCTFFQKGTCKACEKFCPTGAIDFKQEDKVVSFDVGNIILATGWDLFDCRRIPQYGYGRLANVYNSLEFERLSNAAGPTGGKVILRDGVTVPQSVGIIHCVGSRDKNYNPYCSAICCMQSLKFAHLVKEKTGAQVYNFYIDIRTPLKAYDEFYQHILETDETRFVRGKVAEVTDAARLPGEEGKLIIQVEDTLIGKQRRIPVDMVILSAGLEPRHDAKEVAKLFGIGCSADQWFIERHPKLDPVATMTEGVFVAGVCQGPKDIPLSVTQGAAAAARVIGLVNRKQVSLEPVRASVNAEQCSGCRICNNQCPFNAISFLVDKGVSEINPALCQGCGTCVAACPAGAITGSHYTNAQILSQIEGILEVELGQREAVPA
ncbi:MAG: CoB--CoM heterodisulfide reductase iron-sulfur subunit A family protein [Chloroflexi bacterium]|nr:CoB--CoM heterodisulfide reductase iron-sulfur subunit A family protein [Chloroflexota bacterium]MCL5274283.1 CoB--CoM heterodisulfide reductase iron-sulfur subunit A family protein [Chloroflexota bacterium]